MPRDGSPPKSSSTQPSSTEQVLRQRSPLGLAAAIGVIGVVLLANMVWQWGDDPQPLFAAWVIFVLALMWSLLVRPSVVLDDRGVTIRNFVRDVSIPWEQVTDVEYRWNLKVFVGARGFPAWAIASQAERPKGAANGMVGSLMPGLSKHVAADTTDSTSTPKVTAGMVARLIEKGREQYAEAVAQGALPARASAGVEIRWVPMVLAILFVPAIAVVLLSIT